MRSRRTPWTIQELILHPELAPVAAELQIVLRNLVYRSLVKEAPVCKESRHSGFSTIRYYSEC
nr:hypothetical protein [Paenibacillus lactis]